LPEIIRNWNFDLKKALKNVHEEVKSCYYGCGLVVPQVLEGTRILDLGSGSGRDCYILSQLVGESGFVLGIDMAMNNSKWLSNI
tara:strand:+ start:330 stop:581 length:252 start_codon:yes stop_codon:yes gene_type:complete